MFTAKIPAIATLSVTLTLLAPACGDEGGATTATATESSSDATSEDASTSAADTTEATASAADPTEAPTSTAADASSTAASTDDATTGGEAGALVVPGFMAPESVYWEPEGRHWYVSNIVGALGEKDGLGWISRLDADGTLLAAQWVTGFDTPAGLRSFAGQLFVADIDELHVIDIASATITETIAIPGAMFLNDVTVDGAGTVYVSDTVTNTIHRVQPGEAPQVVVQDAGLQAPNGLSVLGDQLVVASIGSVGADEIVAPLFKLDLGTASFAQFGSLTAKFDGVEQDGADLLVTDFRGRLHRIDPTGEATLLRDFAAADGLINSTNFGFDPVARVLGVPDLAGGQIAFWRLPE